MSESEGWMVECGVWRVQGGVLMMEFGGGWNTNVRNWRVRVVYRCLRLVGGGWNMEGEGGDRLIMDAGWWVEYECWRVEGGIWKIEYEWWRLVCGGWSMDVGGWNMEGGVWHMNGGLWWAEDGV